MKSLNLTPAESLMIISPNSSGDEMIKFTLMDLLLKRNLKLDMEEKCRLCICEGESSISTKPHETILIELVLEHHELKLKEFAEILYEKVGSSAEYKNKYIRDPLVEKGYFKRQRKMLLALAPYFVYVLTDDGLELKSKIMELLDEAENLQKWIKNDLGHAKAYLSVLGSHILLTNNYDIDNIKKFNRMLSYLKPESNTQEYYGYYLYSVPNGYLDDYGNLKSFNFLDMSLLDNFSSFNEFFSYLTSDLVKNKVKTK